MMKQVSLKYEQIYCGNLQLINKKYSLRQHSEEKLRVVDSRVPEIQLKEDAARYLIMALEEISAENEIIPVSGYRSQRDQTEIWNDSMKENGEEFTRSYVALPNHSEHETGLAIDLGLNQPEIDFIRPYFPYNGICQKFREIAADFGYVERYEKGKEPITGIAQEPWHFRYVGYPHSNIMKQYGFTLEEYIDFLKMYREDSKLIYKHGIGNHIAIYYIPAQPENTTVSIPECLTYQISGNNQDGFIVTLWGNKDV